MITDNKYYSLIKKNFINRFIVIIAYLFLALFFTFPLILNFRDSLPGGTADPVGGIWWIWFFKYSLLNLHTNPFAHTDLIFYPTGFKLEMYDTLLSTFISIPLQLITDNLFAVYNTIIVLNFVFSCFSTYLLVKYLTGDKKISFIAGIMFGFSSYMLARGLGHLNLLTTGGIPLFVLFFLKLLKKPSAKNSLFLAVSFFIVSLSCWQYGLFTALFAAFSIIFFLITSHNIILNKKIIVSLALFVFLSAIFILPFILPMINGLNKDNINYPLKLEFVLFSADTIAYFVPTPANNLLGIFLSGLNYSTFSGNITESTVYLGLFEIIFIINLIRKFRIKSPKILRDTRYWIIMFILFFILSLGPLLKIGGNIFEIILPYYFMEKFIPFFSFAKEPARMGIFVMLFFTIIFSIFLKNYLEIEQKKIKKEFFLLLLAVIVIAERIELPYPVKKIEIPSFYYQIAKENDDYAILDIPTNIRFEQQSVYNFYQTIHNKKIAIGAVGYTYFSSNIYSWIEDNDFVRESRCYTAEQKKTLGISGEVTKYDKNYLVNEFKKNNIKYLIVHKSIMNNFENNSYSCQKAKNNITDFFGDEKPVYEDEQIISYQLY